MCGNEIMDQISDHAPPNRFKDGWGHDDHPATGGERFVYGT